MENNFYDLGYLDTLALKESPVHRLDPRAKLITTLAFIFTVVSFGKYTLLAFLPFFIYPIVLISLGGLPTGYLLKKILLVSPFAILVGLFNPFIDRQVLCQIGSIEIVGGWVSFLSILIRFFLTAMAALILIALTGFNAVCLGLTKLKVPRAFVVQLLFFYRYLFVLADESQRMERARLTRTFTAKTMSYRTFISMVGHLLLRTLDRAERIYRAMGSRGFDGKFHLSRALKSHLSDFAFVGGWLVLFVFFRLYNVPLNIGKFLTEAVR